jgi:hypothetical protein
MIPVGGTKVDLLCGRLRGTRLWPANGIETRWLTRSEAEANAEALAAAVGARRLCVCGRCVVGLSDDLLLAGTDDFEIVLPRDAGARLVPKEEIYAAVWPGATNPDS